MSQDRIIEHQLAPSVGKVLLRLLIPAGKKAELKSWLGTASACFSREGCKLRREPCPEWRWGGLFWAIGGSFVSWHHPQLSESQCTHTWVLLSLVGFVLHLCIPFVYSCLLCIHHRETLISLLIRNLCAAK